MESTLGRRPRVVSAAARTYPFDRRRSKRAWKYVKIAVSAQYIAAARMNDSSLRRSWLPACVERRNNSARASSTPRKLTSAVSFIIAMNSLPVGGTTTRSACGSTTRSIRWPYDMPRASAASAWPCPTDWIPARKISVMYAP